MKKMVKLLSVVTMALTAGTIALSASAAASHNYKGDINRDDKVDLTDVVFLQKYITGKGYISDQNLVYADVSGDSRINVVDFLLLKRMVISKAAPEEVKITTPAVTTSVTTAKTTAATTAVTSASTSKVSTTASTSASTSKASTTASASASTSKASSATTTTTTTSTTTASSAATTTTTTTTTTTPTTTTTTTTTTASEAVTSKTYPAKVGNGVNSIAPESVDRAFIILGGDNNTCKYDESTNINDFVPGSVQMPEITGDGNYKASFYVYDEGIIDKTGGTFISNTYLRILKAGTWENYTTADKPNLKITVTKATTDGVERDLSGITQESGEASVDISSVLGTVNNVEIEFTVEGFDSTPASSGSSSGETGTTTPVSGGSPMAGTDVNRATVGFGYKALSDDYKNWYTALGDVAEYVGYANDWKQYSPNLESEMRIPEITGNGTYTTRFKAADPDNVETTIINGWVGLRFFGANGTNIVAENPGFKVVINSVKIDDKVISGSELTAINESISFNQYNSTDVNITSLFPTDVVLKDAIEITFTVSGM